MSTAELIVPPRTQDAGPAEIARKCLYYMCQMREVEDRIERKLYRQGKIVGGVYVGAASRRDRSLPSIWGASEE